MDTISLRTLGGGAAHDTSLGARTPECHGHHDLARGYGTWGSHLGFGSYDSRSKLHFALGGGSVPRQSGSGAPGRLSINVVESKEVTPIALTEELVAARMVWRKMMNNTDRENGTMAGPPIFTVPAYGFVMPL